MQPDDLAAVCAYIFGERWQTPLSVALSVSDRNVRHWLSGRHAVPPGVADEILRMAAARQLEDMLPLLRDLGEQHGLPETIALRTYADDSPVVSPHNRPWSRAADRRIKEHLAALLTEAGIPAEVEIL